MHKPRRLPEVLGDYAHRQVARFHMPGHKGRGMGGFSRQELIRYDITELSFSDDLHAPEAAIAQAQEECAACYGAFHTFFLVNGATAGLHALLLSLPRGAHILVGRDCHKSVLSGAALAGHSCRFMQPAYVACSGMWGCVTPETLEQALCESPAAAVLITSPNYYGLCADIPALAAIAHRHGALLFVDAAHGAHFPFSDALPQSPAGYADGWVNSAHKTLNALGQAALLHISDTLQVFKVQRALTLIETSSPSYLLLVSLDWARYTAGLHRAWTDAATACSALSQEIEGILGLSTLPRTLIGSAGITDMDLTRVVIDVSGRGITGYAAQRALEAMDVFVEMADTRRIVCICTPSDDPAWYTLLLKALSALPYGIEVPVSQPDVYPPMPRVMPLAEAVRASVEQKLLSESVGCIAADAAGVYPPGIPLWTPGERITTEGVAFLEIQQALGASLFGVHRNQVVVVRAE